MAVTQRGSRDSRRKEPIVQGLADARCSLAGHPTELGSPKETGTLESEGQRKEVKALHS